MSSASLTILIADDNNTDRRILSAIVQQEGHKVVEATNGEEALERFNESVPDIILMDALMPKMNGFEASRLIKQRAGNQLVPIIFLTSLQDASSLANCLESGGDDFMSKPYNRVILKAKINAFGRMRRMHDQLQSHNRQMLLEQQVAKTVFDNVAHSGCLALPNLRHSLSPLAVFNGDTVLAERKPDGGISLFLGDFTGHGLPAAIGAMPVAEIFYGMTQKGFAMEDVLREINAKLYTILPTEVFCCGAMVDLDVTNKMARIWVGGVPSVYLYRGDSGAVEKVASSNLPLGVLPSRRFSPQPNDYRMHNGDRVFLWSDGIVESHNEAGELFGEERLDALFTHATDPDRIFDDILVAVDQFIGGSRPDDDTTLLSATMVDLDVIGLPLLHSNKASIGGPMDWQMNLQLGPQSLGAFNPLPLVLNILTEVEGLRSLSGHLYTVLAELFNNALEHGVLGLDSKLKQDSQGFAQYYQLREQRLADLTSGQVCLDISHRPLGNGGELTFEITDSGPGFAHSHQDLAYLTDNPDYSGRGLALVRRLCDELDFNDAGNRVRATLCWPRPAWSELHLNG
ncbi:fused response regulator/phosphatase [Saccharospirillum sp. MSK14-1]|uniref:ATP-binding SpoIIE family protein phosphatase n=1 Tax=Saccharospirillum sp. MSK14-1 TaxID=1897632 RepID=UPI000D337918|nr:fused response regulator/phosphatase [Saccharospirillum sp. MSK14-1]PTY36759.1 fused response regulator/phosphatase [Saccharospirillum sp. MSK14-1]